MTINLISGVDSKTEGIGYKGGIPWKNKEDMKWFKKLTTGNACIMGWNTFISLKKPLADRLNIVISEFDALTYFTDCDNSNVRNARSLDEAVEIAEQEKYDSVFIIGGMSIYRQYLERDMVDTLYIDAIKNEDDIKFDTFFPFKSMCHYNDIDYWDIRRLDVSEDGKNTYYAFHRKRTTDNDTDYKYLDLLSDIKNDGKTKHTRAGDTLSVFGRQLRFSALTGIPCITTKKMYYKGCIHELLWFIKGDTNIKYLIDNNCHIWDDDAYRYYKEKTKDDMTKEEFLEHVKNEDTITINGKSYTYGDLGPVYGKQWNDWNGINQINELIEKLKTAPDDRRLMISSWNVGELKYMALPPCHYMSQWYVTKLTDEQKDLYEKYHDKKCPDYGLSVMWSQRSVDMCLGFPYDLLSYSVFLNMVAQCVDMAPLEVICNLGDTHIYKNQLEAADTQLMRNPFLYSLSRLELNENIKNIYDFTYDDISIKDYESYPTIRYQLNVGL